MPSALSVSSPYSISLSEPSVSGGATMTKWPKRPGWSCTAFAAASFHSRDRRRDASTSPNHGPGVEDEPIAISMPFASITSSAFSGVQVSASSPRLCLKLGMRSCSAFM